MIMNAWLRSSMRLASSRLEPFSAALKASLVMRRPNLFLRPCWSPSPWRPAAALSRVYVVHQPYAVGLLGRYPLTRHAHLRRAPPAHDLPEEVSGAQVGPAGPDVDVLGAEEGVFAGEAHIRGERERQARPHGGPVYRRDIGWGQERMSRISTENVSGRRRCFGRSPRPPARTPWRPLSCPGRCRSPFLPAPVTMMTRVSKSRCRACQKSFSSSTICLLTALTTFGRLYVRMPISPLVSYSESRTP